MTTLGLINVVVVVVVVFVVVEESDDEIFVVVDMQDVLTNTSPSFVIVFLPSPFFLITTPSSSPLPSPFIITLVACTSLLPSRPEVT